MARAAAKVRPSLGVVLGAIDVGTNAVRLELARLLPDGTLEVLHQERDPVRPGEGVFKTGQLSPEVADRLLSTLRRYGALCKRYGARVRAVATSAIREAKNGQQVVKRIREEADVELEVVSGREEARLICLGVLHGRPPQSRAMVVDIGGGSTEVASALGEKPLNLWSVAMGSVRLTEVFDSEGRVSPKKLRLMREFAAEAFREKLPSRSLEMPRVALGSSGTINAVVGYASSGSSHATLRELTAAVDELGALSPEERRRVFDPRRAEIIVAGAVILEQVSKHLGLSSVAAVERGLRNGLLVDLARRVRFAEEDGSVREAALAMGRRFYFDEAHASQVAKLALGLFDDLAALHALPASTRPLLEAAALLHDIGNAVNYQKHHKHAEYLIQNADLPGLSDKERATVALLARFHRRSVPERGHPATAELSAPQLSVLRRLVALLRVADSLDRSHHQPIRGLKAKVRDGAVALRLDTKGPVDLELWDLDHETTYFRQVYGRRLDIARGR